MRVLGNATDFPNLGEMADGTSEQRWTAMKKPDRGGRKPGLSQQGNIVLIRWMLWRSHPQAPISTPH
jgi:hypothetical protein